MMLALVLLVAQLDLCTVVKRVVRTSVAGFGEVKGEKREESAKTVTWTAPLKLPGADSCKVIEYKDGSQPFYVCQMQTASCGLAEGRFAAPNAWASRRSARPARSCAAAAPPPARPYCLAS